MLRVRDFTDHATAKGNLIFVSNIIIVVYSLEKILSLHLLFKKLKVN